MLIRFFLHVTTLRSVSVNILNEDYYYTSSPTHPRRERPALPHHFCIWLHVCVGYVYLYACVCVYVGHGGALVESIALNRRVVGSTPALAAM